MALGNDGFLAVVCRLGGLEEKQILTLAGAALHFLFLMPGV